MSYKIFGTTAVVNNSPAEATWPPAFSKHGTILNMYLFKRVNLFVSSNVAMVPLENEVVSYAKHHCITQHHFAFAFKTINSHSSWTKNGKSGRCQ